ncbi:MAG: c-type cytochrome [Flavobacteriaceae bacterium]|jgi:cytochrome c oxidase cbb3-type subunit 3|nr:c-type cytochrome [Flavobacteriaceae bacterium]
MKPRTPFVVNAIIAVGLITGAFYMFLQNFDFITSPIFLATIAISLVLLLINNSLGALIDAEKFRQLSEEQKKEYIELVKTPYLTRLWGDAFKQSKEETTGEVAILDHGFDGIKELDNLLPKWYVGLFAITIVYAVVYFVAYSATDFAHQIEEYDEEYKTQLAAIAEYDKIAPQATIETAEYNPDWVAEGEVIYNQTCKTCHGEGAQGLSGPNQTDDYWINIQDEYKSEAGEFKNIFYTVWNGSKNDATMRPFGAGGELRGNDIVKVSSYLYKLNQDTKKNADGSAPGKAPQGNLAPWSKSAAAPAASAAPAEAAVTAPEQGVDSTAAATTE